MVNFARGQRQLLILERAEHERSVVIRVDGNGSRDQVVAASASTRVGAYATDSIDRPMIAPNERWMAFTSSGNVFVASLQDGRAAPEREWMTVHVGVGDERVAGLSPDGQLLYLLSSAMASGVSVRIACRSLGGPPGGRAVPGSPLP